LQRLAKLTLSDFRRDMLGLALRSIGVWVDAAPLTDAG
jgi:hypothetical protein